MASEQTRVEWQQLLDEALTAPGNLGNVYSRFHDYSITNMMLFMMQGIHEPIASYSRWKSLGRQVVKGAKAKEVIVPLLVNEKPPEDVTDINVGNIEAKRERVACTTKLRPLRPCGDPRGREEMHGRRKQP